MSSSPPDVLGWEWLEAWDACHDEGLNVVFAPTFDPRSEQRAPAQPGQDAAVECVWRVVRLRMLGDDKIELVISPEQWNPGYRQ